MSHGIRLPSDTTVFIRRIDKDGFPKMLEVLGMRAINV